MKIGGGRAAKLTEYREAIAGGIECVASFAVISLRLRKIENGWADRRLAGADKQGKIFQQRVGLLRFFVNHEPTSSWLAPDEIGQRVGDRRWANPGNFRAKCGRMSGHQ